MDIERIKDFDGPAFYRIFSEYSKDTLAISPKEALALLRWLSEHEDKIAQDAADNRRLEAMREIDEQGLPDTALTGDPAGYVEEGIRLPKPGVRLPKRQPTDPTRGE